jgi:hypothetical protein
MTKNNKSEISKMLDKMEDLGLIRSKYLKSGHLVYFVTKLGELEDIYPENHFPEYPNLNNPTTLVTSYNMQNNVCLCEDCKTEINIG